MVLLALNVLLPVQEGAAATASSAGRCQSRSRSCCQHMCVLLAAPAAASSPACTALQCSLPATAVLRGAAGHQTERQSGQ